MPFGPGLPPSAARLGTLPPPTTGRPPVPDTLAASFFLALFTALVLAKVLGAVAQRFGQPSVLGEILAGILIGPTFFHGTIADHLLPTDVRPYLSSLGTVGLAVFMFATGAELERTLLRSQGRVAASVAVASFLLPFALGSGLGLYLAGQYARGNSAGFVLFIGSAVAVTAFPVLARILADRGLLQTHIGGIALGGAMLADLIAWSVLAVVLTVIGAGQWHALLIPAYLALMWWGARPALHRLLIVSGTNAQVVVVCGMFLSCCASQWIGLHYIFGAFVFGAVMPRDPTVEVALFTRRLQAFGTPFLLPLYFVLAGMNVNLSGLSGGALTDLALILLVAVVGKMLGAWSGARLQGMRGRDPWVLAALMNTRGLTELVVLTVGLEVGVLNGALFSLMVVMALVTTFMTGPLLTLLLPHATPDAGTGPDSSSGAVSSSENGSRNPPVPAPGEAAHRDDS
ncbi:cation:proton antiporter [Streptomyces sp. NPDC088350]|uniref:cation:proton antiporter n=1 Tax=Streptomyces sp. NPDC088350 TaxID=3365854 RepID=UPI00381BE309